MDPHEITAVSIYGRGAPSTRVRVTDWLDHLGIANYELLNHAGLASNRISNAWRRAPDLVAAERATRALARVKRSRVLLSREAALLSHGAVERRFLKNAEHGIFDLDDALFHDNRGARRLYGKAAKVSAAASSADVVIAGNEYLANWADGYARDVRVIPSCVDPLDYRPKNDWSVGEIPTIVWLGSPSTERYIEQIAPQLSKVHKLTSARLRLISAPRAKEIPELAPFVERIAWTEAGLAEALSTADLALAPLDRSPYSLGKCAYKLLQYAASGLPIVGSPVGANERALELFDGISVEAHDDWAPAIMSALRESEVRRSIRGLTGLRAVAEHYSFSAWAGPWSAAVGIRHL